MRTAINRIGSTFGRLTVIAMEKERPGKGKRWLCACSCGSTVVVLGGSLQCGETSSCGCLRMEEAKKRFLIHGHARGIPAGGNSTEYRSWRSMLDRCENPNVKEFPFYGGRGITVCERWHNFPNFLQDMGPKPTRKHSIDRTNNSLGYYGENCKWVNASTQARNRRSNINVLINGKTMCLLDACNHLGLKYFTVSARIRRGWPIHKALNLSSC